MSLHDLPTYLTTSSSLVGQVGNLPHIGSVSGWDQARKGKVGALEGYRLWSSQYDETPNPLLALETRILSERIGEVDGSRSEERQRWKWQWWKRWW